LVDDFAAEHIDELDAIVLKKGKDVGFLGQGDQIRLDENPLAHRMPEQSILMSGACAALVGFAADGGIDGEPISAFSKV
jgi:hypothetical protein